MATSSGPLPKPAGGLDYGSWTWEQAVNIFSVGGNPNLAGVPDRTEVTKIPWLLPVNTEVDTGITTAPPVALQADFWAQSFTTTNSYYAWANINYAGLDGSGGSPTAWTAFNMNAYNILEALATRNHPTVNPASFDTMATTIQHVSTWFTTWAQTLKQYRDTVNHKGSNWQGTSAGVFWSVLDNLVNAFDGITLQMQLGPMPSWTALTDAGTHLQETIMNLGSAYSFWATQPSFVDTGYGFGVGGSNISSPAAALWAVWRSAQFQNDLMKTPSQGGYLYSSYFHADMSQPQFWQSMENAAKTTWLDSITTMLDPYTTTVKYLATAFTQDAALLPTITRPPMSIAQPPPPKTPNPTNGPTNGQNPPKTSTGKPPPTNSPKLNGPLTNGINGPNGPNGPGGVTNLGPGGVQNSAPVLVPPGSVVAKDGEVLGPDGASIIGPGGLPLVVPPGSRVNSNGEIVGPNGKLVTNGQADALSTKAKKKPRPPTPVPNPTNNAINNELRSLQQQPPLITFAGPGGPGPGSGLPVPTMSVGGLSPGGGGGITATTGVGGVTTATGAGVSGVTTGTGAGGGAGTNVNGPNGSPTGSSGSGSGPAGAGGTDTSTGADGVPLYPPSAGMGMGGGQQGATDRERSTWLAEDEETWGTDPELPPAVLGRRRPTRTRPGNGRPGSRPSFEAQSIGEGGTHEYLDGGPAATGVGQHSR